MTSDQMRLCLYSFTNSQLQEEGRIELVAHCMCGKFTPFNYSCINGMRRGPCGNNSTNYTAPFSPAAFSVMLNWKEKTSVIQATVTYPLL